MRSADGGSRCACACVLAQALACKLLGVFLRLQQVLRKGETAVTLAGRKKKNVVCVVYARTDIYVHMITSSHRYQQSFIIAS